MWTSTTQVSTEAAFFKAVAKIRPFPPKRESSKPDDNLGLRFAPSRSALQRTHPPRLAQRAKTGSRGRTSIARARPHEPLHYPVHSTAIDLAIRVARNVRDVDEPYGNMRLREPLAAMLVQRLLVQPSVRHDKRQTSSIPSPFATLKAAASRMHKTP